MVHIVNIVLVTAPEAAAAPPSQVAGEAPMPAAQVRLHPRVRV